MIATTYGFEKKWNFATLLMQGMLFCGLCFCYPAFAQEETSANEQTSRSRDSGTGATGSFFDDLARSSRNQKGFSVGVFEMYSTNIYTDSQTPEDATVTSFAPRAFLNLGKRKSRLHLEYGGGYRIYNNHRELDNSDHSGNITYDLQASRVVSFQLSDRATSSTNDLFSSVGSSSIIPPSYPVSSFEPVLDRQRIDQNHLQGTLNFQFSRNSHLGVFSSYDIYHYEQDSPNTNSDGIQVGASYEHRITKWLTFGSTYSTYLNNVEQFQDSKVYRLEVGGFTFKLSRNITLYAAGGAQVLDSNNYPRHVEGTARGRLSRTTRSSSLYISFERAFMSAAGLTQVLLTDTVTAGLSQRLTRKVNFRMSFSHVGGEDVAYSGALKGYVAAATLEYAILSSVIASCNYSYQNQKNAIASIPNAPNVNRSLAYVGLQYLFPSAQR
jgi:hypothetical protein